MKNGLRCPSTTNFLQWSNDGGPLGINFSIASLKVAAWCSCRQITQPSETPRGCELVHAIQLHFRWNSITFRCQDNSKVLAAPANSMTAAPLSAGRRLSAALEGPQCPYPHISHPVAPERCHLRGHVLLRPRPIVLRPSGIRGLDRCEARARNHQGASTLGASHPTVTPRQGAIETLDGCTHGSFQLQHLGRRLVPGIHGL